MDLVQPKYSEMRTIVIQIELKGPFQMKQDSVSFKPSISLKKRWHRAEPLYRAKTIFVKCILTEKWINEHILNEESLLTKLSVQKYFGENVKTDKLSVLETFKMPMPFWALP